jgi:hypothetical protein
MAVETPSRWATSEASIANLLHHLRSWTPLDAVALLDDVATALDDLAPCEEEAEEITQRLCGHLLQLVNIALASGADRRSPYADALVRRSLTLRVEKMPGNHRHAMLHLRQVGWVTGELLDHLVALRSIAEAA